jgi:hypothetical protein
MLCQGGSLKRQVNRFLDGENIFIFGGKEPEKTRAWVAAASRAP